MQRIPGFDLARAYAIWGMFIVNFIVVFGRHDDPIPLARPLPANLFAALWKKSVT